MDSSSSSYRPQSPDLSGYAPQSPDLSGLRPHTPDLSSPHHHNHHHHSRSRTISGGYVFALNPGSAPTSVAQSNYLSHQHLQQLQPDQQYVMPYHDPDDDYLPDAPSMRPRRAAAPQHFTPEFTPNGFDFPIEPMTRSMSQLRSSVPPQQLPPDPTLGIQLKTSFPVARIKRIMQADDEIGKVAQVTPHVVSRALELFMIKLISASAAQARGQTSGSGSMSSTTAGTAGNAGAAAAAAAAGAGKGQKRILAQHMKKALQADDKFDFLTEIAAKIPDAPAKGKKDTGGSDSEDGASAKPNSRRKGKKRKESSEDF